MRKAFPCQDTLCESMFYIVTSQWWISVFTLWLAVISTSTSMVDPCIYVSTMMPFAYLPPASCSRVPSNGSPHIPHLPSFSVYCTWKCKNNLTVYNDRFDYAKSKHIKRIWIWNLPSASYCTRKFKVKTLMGEKVLSLNLKYTTFRPVLHLDTSDPFY